MAADGLGASDFVVVLCTAAAFEADGIAKALIEEKLAACVNIVPVRSCYSWDGKIHVDPEELMIIKTVQRKVGLLKKRILELHSYKVPEIIVLAIVDGYDPYLAWIAGCTG